MYSCCLTPYWGLGRDTLTMPTTDMLWFWMRNLLKPVTRGQGLVEYALIVVLIAVVSIVILRTLGSSVSSVFSRANGAL
jgi:pilus assembly protein Flp/PilA